MASEPPAATQPRRPMTLRRRLIFSLVATLLALGGLDPDLAGESPIEAVLS